VSPVAWQHINLYGRYAFRKAPETIDLLVLIQELDQIPSSPTWPSDRWNIPFRGDMQKPLNLSESVTKYVTTPSTTRGGSYDDAACVLWW
jgi:hypothetical protein